MPFHLVQCSLKITGCEILSAFLVSKKVYPVIYVEISHFYRRWWLVGCCSCSWSRHLWLVCQRFTDLWHSWKLSFGRFARSSYERLILAWLPVGPRSLWEIQLHQLLYISGIWIIEFLHLFWVQCQLPALLLGYSLLLSKLLPGCLRVLILVLLVDTSALQLIITALCMILD